MAESPAPSPTEQNLRHEDVLDRFEAAWRAGPPPALADFLVGDGADRLALLLKLAAVDLEFRLRRGLPACVEFYIAHWPEVGADSAGLLDLVRLEWDHSAAVEPEVARRELSRRFPQLAAEVARLEPPRGLVPPATPNRHLSDTDPSRSLCAGSPAPDIPGYEVLEELGRGGMGVVFKARQVSADRIVALKMIHPAALGDDEAVARFRREVAALTRLQHAHVVAVYEVGEGDGQPFFSMEYCPAGNLADRIAGKPLPEREAANLVRQIALGVAAAHEKGIIHRDLKPANVLLAVGGVPKVADFSLARRHGTDATLTHTGDALGTPAYMAPEQAQGKKDVGPACDVYGLGAILYECLTGRAPFLAPTSFDVLMQVLGRDPVPPSRLTGRLARDLETIVLKCLRKEPPKRYASAAELADDLARWLAGEPIRARRPTLRERLARWRRRRPTTATMLLTGLAASVVLGLAALWYWDTYQRVKVAHYRNYVTRHGVREGVGPLRPDEVRSRSFSYRFHTRGGRVVRLDVVNGAGELTTRHSGSALLQRSGDGAGGRECSYTYARDQQGNLIEETASDRWGNVIWALRYTTPTTAQFTTAPGAALNAPPKEVDTARNPGAGRRRGRAVAGLPQSRARSGASYLLLKRTSEGFLREVNYRDGNGNPTPDDGRVWGVRYDHDDNGFVRRVTYLDADGKPTRSTATGCAAIVYERDEYGQDLGWACFDVEGKPCLYKNGFHRVRNRLDKRGHMVEWTYFGVDDRPCLHAEGMHTIARRFDQHGGQVEWACFGTDGKACLHTNGYHRMSYVYDKRGNNVEWTCFDADGKRCLHKEGLHKLVRRFDERGNEVEWACFGLDDRRCLHKNGQHKVVRQHDEYGNEREVAFYGTDDQPCLHKDGYHRIVSKYGKIGSAVERAYFDTAGRPCLHKDGYHCVRWEYDERGNTVGWSYDGADDRPCLHKDGYHRAVRRHDGQGYELGWTYLGTDGKACLHKDGYHRSAYRYDPRGDLAERAHFDVDGKPTLHKEGYHRIVWQHDGRGFTTGWAYFGADGSRCLHADGYHRVAKTCDNRGKTLEWACFGTNDEACIDRTDGTHRVTRKYDARGNEVEWRGFGTDGKPALHKDGYHREVRRYDERGNETHWSCFGLDGKACLDKSDDTHLTVNRYDARGNLIETRCYGTDEKACLDDEGQHKVVWRYDERDNDLGWACFDTNDKRCADKDGIHRVEQTYDARGRLVEWACFGPDDKRCVDKKDGTHRTVKTYDERGRQVGSAYFGPDGKRCQHKDGFHRSTREYDERGNEVAWACFGVDGKRIRNVNSYSRLTRRHDERGKILETAYFGPDDRPCLYKNNAHRIARRYDARGNEVEWARFDVDDKPMALTDRLHRLTLRYDALGRKRETAGYDPQDRLIVTRHYDEDGDATVAIWEVLDEQRPRYGPAVVRRRQKIDEERRVTAEVFEDVAGKPALGWPGYARYRADYGKGGAERRVYLDLAGRPVPTRVCVEHVAPGSQADKLRLRPGDVLLRYGGQTVSQAVVFERLHRAPGAARPLVVRRDGEEITVTLPGGPHGMDLLDVADLPGRKGRE